MVGWVGLRLAKKLKQLKVKLIEWAKENFGDVSVTKYGILEEIRLLDLKKETSLVSDEERISQARLKEAFQRKLREEEIKWKKRCGLQMAHEGR